MARGDCNIHFRSVVVVNGEKGLSRKSCFQLPVGRNGWVRGRRACLGSQGRRNG